MKLRRAAVHKAQPIKHYKPVEVSKEYTIVIHSEAHYDYTKELDVNMKQVLVMVTLRGFIGNVFTGEAQHQTFDATRAPKFPGLK